MKYYDGEKWVGEPGGLIPDDGQRADADEWVAVPMVTLPTSAPGAEAPREDWKTVTVEAIKPSKTVSDELFALEAAGVDVDRYLADLSEAQRQHSLRAAEVERGPDWRAKAEQEEQAEREFCAAEAREEMLECDRGHRWPVGQGRKEGPSEWTGGVVVEVCSGCGQPGHPAPPAQSATPAPAAYDAQVEHVVRGFLIPACQYRPAEGEPYDPHAPWKLVAFAGGVIAGWVSSFDPELVDRVGLAQRMTDDCRTALLRLDLSESSRAVAVKIAGPKGLAPRLAEALLRLGVER